MATQSLEIRSLTSKAFQPFGDILEVQDQPSVMINQGNCARYTNLASLDFSDGNAGISIFDAKPYASPLSLTMLERHPEGSQAFIPMSNEPFLVIVAEDNNGVPDVPQVFMTTGFQGVNYARNTWHGVLTPIRGNGLFTVIDRIGSGKNLQEHWLDCPCIIEW